MVEDQWWVGLTFMPILSQFSWTLTTLRWSGLSNRWFRVGNICQILHLDSVMQLFCMTDWLRASFQDFPKELSLEEIEQFASLHLIGVNFMNFLWYLLECMRTDLWLEQIYKLRTDLLQGFVDISQGWTCFRSLNWSNFPFISHCWCFAVFGT